MKFLLDTNIYDKISEFKKEKQIIESKVELLYTNVQLSELKNIPNETKRERLLTMFEELNPKKKLLESGIWIDALYWDDDQPWIDEVGPNCLEFTKGKSNKPWRDALIGELRKFSFFGTRTQLIVSG